MGWEYRGANKYYYRKEREGSRVKSVYVGRGAIANLVSDLQDSSGLFDEAISIAYPSVQENLKEGDAEIEQVCSLIQDDTSIAACGGVSSASSAMEKKT